MSHNYDAIIDSVYDDDEDYDRDRHYYDNDNDNHDASTETDDHTEMWFYLFEAAQDFN